jgi:hypothetical protein
VMVSSRRDAARERLRKKFGSVPDPELVERAVDAVHSSVRDRGAPSEKQIDELIGQAKKADRVRPARGRRA